MLNQLRDEIHQNALEHGWWEEQRSFGEIIALCHSELSEALEEYRNGIQPNKIYHSWSSSESAAPKPEGVPIELADCIIRILDYCGQVGINIEEAVITKHEYNKTRPYKHGGKKL